MSLDWTHRWQGNVVDLHRLVVRDGDLIRASGTLGLDAGRPVFCHPGPPDGGGNPTDGPSGWSWALPVTGPAADRFANAAATAQGTAATVPGAMMPEATVPGATVIGTWQDDGLLVHDFDLLPGPPPFEWPPGPTTPPDPPPDGRWPLLPQYDEPQVRGIIDRLYAEGTIVWWAAVGTPRPRGAIVVTTTQADRVRALLTPRVGEALRVVPSAWSRERVRAVSRAFVDNERPWGVLANGEGVGVDWQLRATASVVRVPPDLARWAGELPDGMLNLQVWLRPATALPSSSPG